MDVFALRNLLFSCPHQVRLCHDRQGALMREDSAYFYRAVGRSDRCLKVYLRTGYTAPVKARDHTGLTGMQSRFLTLRSLQCKTAGRAQASHRLQASY